MIKKIFIAIVLFLSIPLVSHAQVVCPGSFNPIRPNQGGTGTSTCPQYGQVLVGDGTGYYNLLATSSLGITGGGGGSGTVTTLTAGSNIIFSSGTTCTTTCTISATGSGGAGTGLATTTADYIVYNNGNLTQALKTKTNSIISSNTSADVVLNAIVADSSTVGANIYVFSGTYYLNATTTLPGTTDAAGITWKIWGAGQSATNFVVNNNADAFYLKGSVKTDMLGFSIYLKGASNGLIANSNGSGFRSVWNSDFDALMIRSTTTDSTGFGIYFTNDFRNTYNNIQFLGLGGGIYTGTESTNTFNNGDSVYQNMMCDLSQNSNTGHRTCYYFDGSSGASLVNQDSFTDVNAFSLLGNNTAWYFNHTKWMTAKGINSEGFATTTEFVNDSDNNNFEFEYNIGSTTSSTYYSFDSTSSANTIGCRYVASYTANHILFSDANTDNVNPNIIQGVSGSTCATHGTGTFGFSTTSASIVRQVSYNGVSNLANVQNTGNALALDFTNGALEQIKNVSGSIQINNNGNNGITVTNAGLVGLNTANPSTLLDVNGTSRLRNNVFMTQTNGGVFFAPFNSFTRGIIASTSGELVLRAGGNGLNNLTIGTTTATSSENFVVTGTGNRLASGPFFNAYTNGLLQLGYTPYNIYQDDYQSLVVQGGYPGYYAPRSILDLKAPDQNPQESTFTAERPVNGGCFVGGFYTCREFMDIGIEDYSPEGPSTGIGPDHLAYIGINKQGSGTTTPFVIRFWDLDTQPSVVFATPGLWVDPAGATAIGSYASTTGNNIRRYDPNIALQVTASSSTQTQLFAVDSSPRTHVFTIDRNGLASTTNLLVQSTAGNSAGTFLAADPTGKIIATTTPSGGSGVNSVTATYPLASSGGTNPNITYSGIGTSSNPVIGGNAYWTSSNTLGTEATGTITCAGTASCGTGSYVLGNNLTITGAGGTSASSTLLGDNNTFSGNDNFTKSLGIGSTSPFAKLSVEKLYGDTNTLLASFATSTSVDGSTVVVKLSIATNGSVTSLGSWNGVGIGNSVSTGNSDATLGDPGNGVTGLSFSNSAFIDWTKSGGALPGNLWGSISFNPNTRNILFGLGPQGDASGNIVAGQGSFGSSSPYAVLTAYTASTSDTRALFNVGTSTGTGTTTQFLIDRFGHKISGGSTPTLTACGSGTGPFITGTDDAGTVETGGGLITDCSVVFANSYAPYKINPLITVDGSSLLAYISATSTTGFTVHFNGTATNIFFSYTTNATIN